jgi:hypothetical protein
MKYFVDLSKEETSFAFRIKKCVIREGEIPFMKVLQNSWYSGVKVDTGKKGLL